MGKREIVFIIAILFALTGCSNHETTATSPEVKVINSDLKQETSEAVVLDEYLDLIEPILDYSIFYNINQLAGNIVNWASTRDNESLNKAKSYHEEITITLTGIIEKETITGYGFKADWDLLSNKCSSIRRSLNKIIMAAEDNDAGNALSDKSIYDNTEILRIALVIQNKIMQENNYLEMSESEPIISEKLAFEKALRYAKFLYGSDDLILERRSDFGIINNIGKYYDFVVVNDIETTILINVETAGIVLYRNNIYEFVPDTILPAIEGEASMPDVIGMKKDDALALITSLGLDYQVAFIADESWEEGTVQWSTPEAGKAVFDDTIISLIIALPIGDESSEYITRDNALRILEANVVLHTDQYFGDGSVRFIDGKEYYLFTVNNEITVDGAYCIDIETGELFICDEALTLTPFSTD